MREVIATAHEFLGVANDGGPVVFRDSEGEHITLRIGTAGELKQQHLDACKIAGVEPIPEPTLTETMKNLAQPINSPVLARAMRGGV